MLRLDNPAVRVFRVALDCLAILLGFWVAYGLHGVGARLGWLSVETLTWDEHVKAALMFAGICVAAFWNLDLYREKASVLNLREYQSTVKGVFLAAAIFFTLLFLFRLSYYSRMVIVVGILVSVVFIVVNRRLMSGLVRRLELGGRLGRNVLIYGIGETGKLLMKKLLQAPHRGSCVVGFIDDFAPKGATVTCRIDQQVPAVLFEAKILGRLRDLPRIVQEHHVDELLVTVPLTNAERHQEIVELARELSIELGVVPKLGELRADLLDIEDLSAIPVVRPGSTRPRRIYPGLKRALDLAVATVVLVVTSPLWLLAAIAIKLDSEGPVLFRQRRIGFEGQPITIYKFRTMELGADPYSSSPEGDMDPHITRVGRVLRIGGFDELPQLINVLKGEMSMVGPRPEMPFIVEQYTPLQRQRLMVKPGITGLWQLSSDRHTEIHENLEYDLYYMRHQSILLDLLVLMETVFFTVGLFPRVTGRRVIPGRLAQPVGGEGKKPEPDEKVLESGYAVAILDQRVRGALPRSWVTSMPALYGLSSSWPLKVVVAPDNVPAFDTLTDEPFADSMGSDSWIEYVPYTSRSELRAVTLGARVIVTDLDHVRDWGKEGGIDVLYVSGGRIQWLKGRSGLGAFMGELVAVLQQAPEPEETSIRNVG